MGHGVAGIERQVHDCLVHLRLVSQYRFQGRIQLGDDLDVLSEQPTQQLGNAVDDKVEVEHGRCEHLLARGARFYQVSTSSPAEDEDGTRFLRSFALRPDEALPVSTGAARSSRSLM